MADIHIDVKLSTDLSYRDILASTFGLAADAPPVVTTGCEHLRQAELVELLAGMPGSAVSPGQAAMAAARHRERAARFAFGP